MVLVYHLIVFVVDQLNTSVHATTKVTPYELVFGQPPRSNLFPGAMGVVMEEDVADLVNDGMGHVVSSTELHACCCCKYNRLCRLFFAHSSLQHQDPTCELHPFPDEG